VALAPAASEPRGVAVVGLGFGDEGKGSVVDALARRLRPSAVVRFNGGPQAAHHVLTPDGRLHCFAQLGSALLASPDVRSFSTSRVLVDPLSLLREAESLACLGVEDPLARLSLDPRSVVVTPFHRLLNRAAELARGQRRHGSCGLGVGQAYADSLNPAVPTVRLAELGDLPSLRRKLELIRWMKLDLAEQLRPADPSLDLGPLLRELGRRDITDVTLQGYAALADRGVIHSGGEPVESPGLRIFEGAQGVLLDERHGFWPHVTPSTTTFLGADEVCREVPYHLGLLRAFSTRHGAGPFVAERPGPGLLRGEHNALNDWQGSFRVGAFDLVMARYALAVVGGVDGLGLTCLDRCPGEVELVRAWRYEGDRSEVEDLLVFDGSSSRVEQIRAERSPSRERQQRLADALRSCRPLVEVLPGVDALTDEVARQLGAPIVLRSRGPRATDKEWDLASFHAHV
jgi:adenylosuccinate synthase